MMAKNFKSIYEFESQARFIFPPNNVSPNLICPIEILQVFSPLEFYVSHLCFAETVTNMERTMQLFYTDEVEPLNEVC